MTCVFCDRIVAGEITIATAEWVMFPDKAEKPGYVHALLVPVFHVQSLTDLDGPSLVAFGEMLRLTLDHFNLGQGYKLAVNGPDRMAVPHLHVHVTGLRRHFIGVV